MLHAEFGQRVIQRRRIHRKERLRPYPAPRSAARTGCRAARRNSRSASSSRGLSGSSMRSTSTVTASPTASSICGRRVGIRQAGDQLAQAAASRSDMRRGRTSQLAMSATKLLLRLVKADQHAAFLRHQAHRHARAVAIAPGQAVDRRAAASPAAPCRCATGCLRARAASPPPARALPGAACCSRRRRRNGGSAAARAPRSARGSRSPSPARRSVCSGRRRRTPSPRAGRLR